MNPYKIYWHILRWKFIAIERVCLVGTVLYSTRGLWRHIAVIYLDFAIGNMVDRLIFNYQKLGWNDLLIYIFAIWYLFKNLFPKKYLIVYLWCEPWLIIPFLFLFNQCKSAWHKIILCLKSYWITFRKNG